jgi:SAM-dependent methyltransferase
MTDDLYVHGYSEKEQEMLEDQANALMDLLHRDTRFSEGSKVLEAGCGTGAQTIYLASNSPGAHFVSVDRSEESLSKAKERLRLAGHTNVTFRLDDIFGLEDEEATFDHVFVCFVLEHLDDPIGALTELKRVLKDGGTMTVIEGDHGSAFFYPDSQKARKAIQCLVDLQAAGGGDSMIGRRLYPLLTEAGLNDLSVSPRMVYADPGRPDLLKSFTLNTFTAMVRGVRKRAVGAGLVNEAEFDAGIRDLERTAGHAGVFCYTFFKAVGVKGPL